MKTTHKQALATTPLLVVGALLAGIMFAPVPAAALVGALAVMKTYR